MLFRIFLWNSLLVALNFFSAHAQCSGFNVTNLTYTDVTCNGLSDGTITVTATGGTGPYQYSIGGGGATIQNTQTFTTNNMSTTGGSGPTNVWWSPSSCTGGVYFQWSAVNGCPAGGATFVGNSQGYTGCFLRSPQIDMSGFPTARVTFDITNSYSVGRPLDKIRVYVWVNNSYPSQALLPITINGAATRDLYFDQARSCVPVTVDLDMSGIISRTDFFFYIEAGCGYSNCTAYSVTVDNISITEGTVFQVVNQFTELPPGNYNITVQDSNGCTATYSSNPVVISEPPALVVNLTPTNPSMIGGNDGSIGVSISGGTPPYNFSASGGNISGNFITDLTAGNYCITATDFHNCTAVQCTTLVDPSCTGFAISGVNVTQITCNGANNGALTVMVTGGSPSYQYSIDGGSTFQLSNTFTGLIPGMYDVAATDGVGCFVLTSATVTQPPALGVSFVAADESAPGALDGAIDLTVSGGNGSDIFTWSNGATTEDITNLSGDTYCVTVTDSKGCTITGCDTVTTLSSGCAGFKIDSVKATAITCHGENDGQISIYPAAGTPPVFYSIDSGTTWQTNNSVFTSLAPGNYNIIIRDNNSCVVVYNKNPVQFIDPAPLNPPIIGTNGNVLTASGTGSFQWYFNGNMIPGATSQSYTAAQSGSYYVELTSNGCTKASSPVNIVVTGMAHEIIKADFIVFPNPAAGALHVELSLERALDVRIAIFDLRGKELLSFPSLNTADYKEHIDVSRLPASIYWIKVQAGQEVFYRKFIKS